MFGMVIALCLSASGTVAAPTDTLSDSASVRHDSLVIMPEMRKQICDPWFGQDKLLHFSAGFAIPGLTYHFYVCRLDGDEDRGKVYAVSLTALAALGKELYDSETDGLFSWKDLAWGGLGLIAGYMLFVH